MAADTRRVPLPQMTPHSISLALLLLAGAAAAQPGPPAVSVRFTEARELDLSRSVELVGSVESRSASVVAAAVDGVVAALPAREGDRVARGAPLVVLDAAEAELLLAAARGELEEAAARLTLARSNLERFRGLYEDQIISRQELDDAVAEEEAWRGRKTQLAADVERLERDVRLSVIRAPFSGTVVAEHTAVGQWLAVGEPAAEVVDLSDLEVTVEVPEREIGDLRPGAGATVAFEALPGLEVEGEVRAVVPKADPRGRSFPVKISIPNPEYRISVGMLARVRLPVGRGRVLAVPKDAVVDQGAERVVFVVTADETVRRAVVRTGVAQGVWLAVEGDLAAGDRVVVRGNERLLAGQTVRGEALEYPLP